MKKNLFALLATAVMACCALTAPASAAESYIPGDVNLDGVVDTKDAILILQDFGCQICDTDGILTPEQRQIGNLDGEIFHLKSLYGGFERDIEADLADAMHILQYFVSNMVDPEVTMEDVLGRTPNFSAAVDAYCQEFKFIWDYETEQFISVER